MVLGGYEGHCGGSERYGDVEWAQFLYLGMRVPTAPEPRSPDHPPGVQPCWSVDASLISEHLSLRNKLTAVDENKVIAFRGQGVNLERAEVLMSKVAV